MQLRYQAALQNTAAALPPLVPLADLRHIAEVGKIDSHVIRYSDDRFKDANGKPMEMVERMGVYHFSQAWMMQGNPYGVSHSICLPL